MILQRHLWNLENDPKWPQRSNKIFWPRIQRVQLTHNIPCKWRLLTQKGVIHTRLVMLHATVKPGDECPIQGLDYDRTNLLKIIHPGQSLWIENNLQNVILGVKNSVTGRIEMHLRSFQTIQIWNDFSLDASSTLAYFRRHLCFICNSLSSLKMKIHKIAANNNGEANIKINKRYHAIFRTWWLGYNLNIASIIILKDDREKYVHFIF